MISKYCFNENCLELLGPDDDRLPDWIDLADPTAEEVAELISGFDLPGWIIADPLDENERPRIDAEGPYILILTRAPYFEDSTLLKTVPVGFIKGPSVFITICRQPGLVTALVEKASRKRHFNGSNYDFLRRLLSAEVDSFIEDLNKMEEMTKDAEDLLEHSLANKGFITLLDVEKGLIHLMVALKSNHQIITKLATMPEMRFSAEELEHLDDILIESQQAIFTADIFTQILGSIGDAFGNIVSNNLNNVMKFLTGITIILMLPTILVGLYGMNVSLPFEQHPLAFWGICLAAVIGMAWVWRLFTRRKWM